MLYIDGRFLSYNDKNDFDTPVLKSKLPFDATVNSYLSIYSMPCNWPVQCKQGKAPVWPKEDKKCRKWMSGIITAPFCVSTAVIFMQFKIYEGKCFRHNVTFFFLEQFFDWIQGDD